jgi:hypothetical protein
MNLTGKCKECFEKWYETRQQATEKAIEKANEIYNKQ